MPLSAASLEGVEEAQRDALLGERLYALLSATHAAEQAYIYIYIYIYIYTPAAREAVAVSTRRTLARRVRAPEHGHVTR